MSCIFPDSENIEEFWQNILSKHVSFKEVPEDRWDPNDFYNEDGGKNKTYSKIGAFVEDYEFDWRRWRQPPELCLKSIYVNNGPYQFRHQHWKMQIFRR